MRPTGYWLLLLLVLACLNHAEARATAQNAAVAITLGNQTFLLEVAADPATRYRGLSDRAQLAAGQGMLFVYPKSVSTAFVMRRCLIPIDVVIIDRNGVILMMHEMQVEPYDTPELELKRYPSGPGMRYAIELAGGEAASVGLSVGDRIELTDQIRRINAR